ncbi:unnamed protein product [Caenorhabditis auriculariae]|uniref:Uncharacterized protein n=1 Tax=Caenorhabditis auriculariae TaxID=2777116 RepID=A0A8S1HRX8_9PELO|nr:unnamed protein product [Caenorhabditis auriculariae]
MEVVTLIGFTGPAVLAPYNIFFDANQISDLDSYYFILSMCCPHILMFIDAVLCLHRLLSFFEVAPWPLALTILTSIPSSFILIAFATMNSIPDGKDIVDEIQTAYQWILVLVLHIIFIGILIKCYSEDKKVP